MKFLLLSPLLGRPIRMERRMVKETIRMHEKVASALIVGFNNATKEMGANKNKGKTNDTSGDAADTNPNSGILVPDNAKGERNETEVRSAQLAVENMLQESDKAGSGANESGNTAQG